MTDNGTHGNEATNSFLQVEYTALRSELMKRVELGARLLEVTLVSAAAILTVNATDTDFSRVLLAYPVLVMFLAFAGLHNGLQVRILAAYIRTEIEPKFRWRHNGEETTIGYEAWLVANAPRQDQRLGIYASIAMFVAVQVLVFAIGLVELVTGTRIEPVDVGLIIVGGGVIIATAVVMFGQLRSRR